jgi:coenzyme F420-reducing hydrogenase delta subunit/Pyruvate/2-oxoacid:ferredoxin oxidoreductase delta subunit
MTRRQGDRFSRTGTINPKFETMKSIETTDMTTVIFGAGKTARRVAEKAAAIGAQVLLVTEERPEAGAEPDLAAGSFTLLSGTRLKSCRGRIGDFEVALAQNGATRTVQAAHLVLAEPDRREANFADYGLSPSDTVISLSDLNTLLADPAALGRPAKFPSHFAFLHGIAAESSPVIAEEVMTAATRLQIESGVQAYVLVGNLKVAGSGLEALYRRSKEAGVFYVKFTDTAPDIRQENDGSVVIEFADEITNRKFSLRPDMTVVDETIRPSQALARLARVLDLETDENGFAQADNVHRWTVGTNRRGVVSIGPARALLSENEQQTDAAGAVARIARGPEIAEKDRARIDPGRCIRCLTCFRLCPYGAIRITAAERVEVMAEACERCGICAAECPRTAIRIPGLDRNELVAGKEIGADASVSITAFCCTRSAEPASRLARRMGLAVPGKLTVVEVPCAGAVSLEHLMAAFSSGADGVMVLSCHADNCHSREGNVLARDRVELLASRLAGFGVDPKRLAVHTLASNMGVEFAQVVEEFSRALTERR